MRPVRTRHDLGSDNLSLASNAFGIEEHSTPAYDQMPTTTFPRAISHGVKDPHDENHAVDVKS